MSGQEQATQTGVRDVWFKRFHPSTGRHHRLVCFPHAGGPAATYRPHSGLLAPGVEVLAVQYPGRHDRYSEPLLDEIPVLADRIYDALRKWADEPVALFGHSMGSVVAFEVARRMERAGTPPRHLFVSGRRAPMYHREDRVHLLDDKGLVEEIETLGGTQPGVLDDPAVVRMVLPVVRNDYRAIEMYRCPPGSEALLSGTPVTALVGDSDPRCSTEEVAGWGHHTREHFAVYVIPGGGHFYLLDEPTAMTDRVVRTLATAS